MSDDDLFTDSPAPAGGLFTDEPAPTPKSLAGFGHNVVEDVKGTAKGLVDLGGGLMNHPVDTLEAIPKGFVNEGKRIGLGELLTGHPINAAEKFGNAAYDKPLSTLMDVAPVVGAAGKALGIGGAAAEGADAAANAAKAAEAASDLEKAAPAAAELPKPPVETPLQTPPNGPVEVPPAATSLKDLPVVQPGIKTGDPHALFAYNDEFGPGKTPRSLYNIFGDPGHPRLTQAGGYGSSVTKDILDKAGIPVVGRDPRSVGKWEPIEAVSSAPPGVAGEPKAAPEPPPASPKPSMFETGAQKAMDQGKEVKDYISRGYEGYAKKPGALADIADYIQEKSQAMAAQQIGITPNQARQLGRTPQEAHNAMRAIGQYALDKEIVSPTTGLSGMLDKNAALMKTAGKTLGDFRKEADTIAGQTLDPKEVVKEVRAALDKKYMRTVTNAEGEESGPRGAYGGQAGAYQRALQEVEDSATTHAGIADAATELNHAANKAAKNLQPETPFTDVANEVSRVNNERIKQLLGPEKALKYEQALREYGVNKKIANALKFKSSGEVKRFGPGSIVNNFTQKLMDEAGYRLGAKAANKLSTSILNKPGTASNLPSLFKEFIHQVEDVGHDVTGMAKGGMVPDDVRQYVSSRC